MVLATQNPIEQEGTYPLPEAQMDRFLMKVNIDYPDDQAELDVIRLVRGEEKAPPGEDVNVAAEEIFNARREIQDLHIAEAVEQYIVALVMATRNPARLPAAAAGWIDVGSSPRASIALDRAARAHAWLAGKDFVDPDDVRAVAFPVLRHRMILGYEAAADGISSDRVIEELLKHVAVA
jgi:MoxR-like ATPase